jgi:hypothetical protein
MPEMCERGLQAVQVVRLKADDTADSGLVNAYEEIIVETHWMKWYL